MDPAKRPIIRAVRKNLGSSIGTSSTATLDFKKLVAPPPPSIGSAASSTSGRSRSSSSETGSKRGSETSGSQSRASKRARSLHYSDSITNNDELEMSQENKNKLINEQREIDWLRSVRCNNELTYDSLVLGRRTDQAQPDTYVHTTFCNGSVLQHLMDVKYNIRKTNEAKYFETRTKITSFCGLDEVLFHNPDALKMANIDALMNFELSNPKNSRGETLLKPNELLYFVDIYGSPGGAAEYFLWKKNWNAHGFGFTDRNNDYDLPFKNHYCAEAFEAINGFWGKKGKGDITDPEDVEFFMKQVRKFTAREGVHVVVAQGGVTNPGSDEDRKELRAKYMLLAEFMIALRVLREGGTLVLKVFDMFTSFTVGLVYLIYRVFDKIAIFKPETCLQASAERYILCKHRKANKFIAEVDNFLNDCLRNFRNSQRLHKGSNDDVMEIIDLVPSYVIRDAPGFYDYIIHHNSQLGSLQLRQTADIIANLHRSEHYITEQQRRILKKARSMWGIPERFKQSGKLSDASTPDLRGAKLVRPYPPDVLLQIERDGEQMLSFSNLEDELTEPREWHFVPVGRDRGFFLSLGGQEVYRYTGTGTKWEKLEDRMELCNNTLVYGDIIEEITVFEDEQRIKSGLNIIDAMLLGGKDIRALPYVERIEMCQKFAKAMNKANRNDVAAIRCKEPKELIEIGKSISLFKNQRLKGGRGPVKEAIYPVDDSAMQPFRKNLNYNPVVFRPQGFSFFKTCKGNGVAGDFLYCLQNRLYWRFTDEVNLDPHFDDWKEDAEEKHGPIHAAFLIHYLKARVKK